MTWWHGGAPGLRRGDTLLPPSVTGAKSLADYGTGVVCSRDRVYLGSYPAVAVIYAACHPSGQGRVYEVEANGDVEPDRDWLGEHGVSVCTTSARVLAVHDPRELLAPGVTLEAVRASILALPS